jgi:hypothetical protein
MNTQDRTDRQLGDASSLAGYELSRFEVREGDELVRESDGRRGVVESATALGYVVKWDTLDGEWEQREQWTPGIRVSLRGRTLSEQFDELEDRLTEIEDEITSMYDEIGQLEAEAGSIRAKMKQFKKPVAA